MSAEYVAEVRRFGGPSPYVDSDGNRRNLAHKIDFPADRVKTDGNGNIHAMPLLLNKPCFGRPERFYRAAVGSAPWIDDHGERRPGDTPCHSCFKLAPGVYEACFNLSEERVASLPVVQAALNEWMEAVGATLGRSAFLGRLGQRWGGFLEAIATAGGWTSVNDDQVRIQRQAVREARRRSLNEKRKAKRKAARDARTGTAKPITFDFIKALGEERDRRAQHLKALRPLPVASGSAMSWLNRMSDTTCERVADVWRERELRRHAGEIVTQRKIVERMWAAMQRHGASSEKVLAARVNEDFKKRLSRLEDAGGGAPIWLPWVYVPN